MRLFYELNENLNAYKQGFEKNKVLSDEFSSQLVQKNGEKFMPVSIHVHHALMDGYEVGIFVDKFQNLMNG